MSSTSSLYAALVDVSKEAVRRLDEHPVGGRLVRGNLPAPLYAAYLTHVVRQVRESAPMLADASRRLERRGRGTLAALLGTKASEEDGHDRWALDDLAVLGVTPEQVYASPAPAALNAYVAWTRYCAEQAPTAVLGLAWVLEWFGYARAGRAADNLVAHSGIPRIESAVKFLRGHGEADRHHIEALAAGLWEITDAREAAGVVLSAQVTATLYTDFFGPQ
ncbi:MAG TPA: iron-containing redox enzyme family protein [Polyangiaceae bacterium]|nr:iron-containing redox enzyme family protein [Polyangiaceae bacterium]